jgi:hypothetical protein
MTRLGELPGVAERLRARPCWRKVRYRSDGAALAAIRGLAKLDKLQPEKGPVRPYRCDDCAGWHVGHGRTPPVQ